MQFYVKCNKLVSIKPFSKAMEQPEKRKESVNVSMGEVEPGKVSQPEI